MVRPFKDKILRTGFVCSSDSDSGKGGPEAEEDISGHTLETLSLDDELTPALSNASLRSGSVSTPSVTPLGELLTPSTATSQPAEEEERADDRVRDSTTETDLGDIDEARFSTVALNILSSKRSSTTSHVDSGDRRSSTASFLLAKAQDTQFRHSLDGHRELQDEFEKAHANEDDADAAAKGVDWGMFYVFSPYTRILDLQLVEFWGAVMSDYQTYATENPEELARAIENGIPHTLRGMVWQMMAASKDPAVEKLYLTLIKETSPHEKAITRDLGRTFPQHAFFRAEGLGQENLFNVLKAYSLWVINYHRRTSFI